ncbi:site-specific integrase [Olivibacter sp. SDN3]|uniref:site-specific integrase n=1 Tax=Olivibacter sp. SDN3 TaxID=2764720 RepID=UPI001651751F|nr:site-specific integrase [Olivibacter sp. SDN3]QNL49851.1 site-specific integrase [Olivibacter sp. SDN3]
MTSHHTFNFQFFLKKDKASKGTAPLYARIWVDGVPADLSLKYRVNISSWNHDKQKIESKTNEDERASGKLRSYRKDIDNAYDELVRDKQPVSSESIKAKVLGVNVEISTLKALLKYHNTVIGKVLTEGTMKNYRTTERFIHEFISLKKRVDIHLSQIGNQFITDFKIFLLTRKPDKGQRPCSNNTAMKHMERLKKMVGIALKNKWIKNDPFEHFERKMVRKDREPLDSNELERFRKVKLFKFGQIVVQDMFLFSCYTGLGYSEICNFSHGHIIRDENGDQWLEMTRKKTFNTTEQKFFVLLLPEALELIEKYRNHPASLGKGTIFPYYTNQTTNRYLKVIAALAGISKKVTFHVARHTFATTVTLENGVSIESVSAMLGHASIRTTQIYAKVKKKKVANDMKSLMAKRNESLLHAI